MLSLPDIALLFARHGTSQYSGEPVTQLQHALQAAHLAEASGADDALVTACLLHDLGHLLNDQGETPSLRGIDDTHQYYALPFLRGLFPSAVLDAIKLHVDANATCVRPTPTTSVGCPKTRSAASRCKAECSVPGRPPRS